MNKIKWGILGPGRIAQQFAHDFQYVENAEVIAVASQSEQRAKEFALLHSISKVYTSYEALYADPEIDIIYIATPHSFHFEQTSAALLAGKNVLCEKPITTNFADAKQLFDLAKKQQLFLMEGMWSYFLPAIQAAKKWVDDGKIGTLLHLKSNFGYSVPFDPKGRMYNPELAGGALLDMGIYTIAMAELFIHETAQQQTVISKLASTGVDEDVQIITQYPTATANLHTAFTCKLHNSTYIIGTEGYIEIPDFWRANTCSFYIGEELKETYTDPRKGFGFEYEIRSVSESILNGVTESDIVPVTTSLTFQNKMAEIATNFQQS